MVENNRRRHVGIAIVVLTALILGIFVSIGCVVQDIVVIVIGHLLYEYEYREGVIVLPSTHYNSVTGHVYDPMLYQYQK